MFSGSTIKTSCPSDYSGAGKTSHHGPSIGTQRTAPGISPPIGQRQPPPVSPPPIPPPPQPRPSSFFRRIQSILGWSLASILFVGLSIWKEAHGSSQNRGTEESASQLADKTPENSHPQASTVKPRATDPTASKPVVPKQMAPTPVPHNPVASPNSTGVWKTKSAELDAKLRHHAETGNWKSVEVLLWEGANVNATDNESGQTALHRAAKFGHQDVVSRLLEKGADVNQADKKGRTPLWHAADEGHREAVARLLEKGAKVNQPDSDGWSPIYVAAGSGHRDVIELLLEKGAPVNGAPLLLSGSHSTTPLHWATISEWRETVELLLKKGAAVNQADNFGRAPLHYAAEKGYRNIVALLLGNGAAVNQTDDAGKTPLMLAEQKGYREVVDMLLVKSGAVMQAPTKEGLADEAVADPDRHNQAREAINKALRQVFTESPEAREAARRRAEQERTLAPPSTRASN